MDYSAVSEQHVKKASEYLEHAQECRALASRMTSADDRDQLLRMAEMWECMADDRSAMVTRHPEVSTGVEPENGAGHLAGQLR